MLDSDLDKPYKLATFRDRGGDLNKEWYVEFYAYSDSKKDIVRSRVKIPTSCGSAESRLKFAAKKIKEIDTLLREGFYFKSQVTDNQDNDVDTPTNEFFLIESLYQTIKDSGSHLRKKSKSSYRPDDYLFGKNLKSGPNGCSENMPYNRHREALEAVGLQDHGYTLYSWKHSGAVNAY